MVYSYHRQFNPVQVSSVCSTKKKYSASGFPRNQQNVTQTKDVVPTTSQSIHKHENQRRGKKESKNKMITRLPPTNGYRSDHLGAVVGSLETLTCRILDSFFEYRFWIFMMTHVDLIWCRIPWQADVVEDFFPYSPVPDTILKAVVQH